jgi:hypothetical protein
MYPAFTEALTSLEDSGLDVKLSEGVKPDCGFSPWACMDTSHCRADRSRASRAGRPLHAIPGTMPHLSL